MKNKDLQPKQLILLHFNNLVEDKPLIFAPFQLYDKMVKAEEPQNPLPTQQEEHSHLERI